MREQMTMQLPRPGKALIGTMMLLVAVWVVLAASVNWLGGGPTLLGLLAGNAEAIREGQVWRLFTAGLIHDPTGLGHIMMTLIGLYFLGPTLESRWGGQRMVFFLIVSTVMSYCFQFAAESLLPAWMVAKLGQEYWIGATGAVEAIAVAWALSNRAQTINLFFVLPITGMGLFYTVVGFSLAYVLLGARTHEGLITPFGGMVAGYLFGSGTPSPARRILLKARYFWISRRAANYRRTSSGPKLRVIEGGESRESRRKPPTDKRFLN
jgi:membrane associated rhomboid family serine protease